MAFQTIGKRLNIDEIKKFGSLSKEEMALKASRDKELLDIISGRDARLLLIIGPCSADNTSAVLEYARRLSRLQKEVQDKIFMVMRVYTSKPRTNGEGYKGLIHQSDLSAQSNFVKGIQEVRELQHNIISETGLTIADELLYTENLPLVEDLLSYVTIGARSVENQVHRFVASGIDLPVGMKNPTSGNLNIMFNALYAAQRKQSFPYNREEVLTTGNPLAHAILRGGHDESAKHYPNYQKEALLSAIGRYEQFSLQNPLLIVDTNHDNSGKKYMDQIRIVKEVLAHRESDEKIKRYVRGFMIESYLEDGRQDMPEIFGKSITDPCLGWEETEKLVRKIKKILNG